MRVLLVVGCVLLSGCPERTRPARGVLLTYAKEDRQPRRAAVDRRLAQLKLSAQLSEDDGTLSVRLPEGADVARVKALLARPAWLELCAEDAARARAWCGSQWPEGVRPERAQATCALRAEGRAELERALAAAAEAEGRARAVEDTGAAGAGAANASADAHAGAGHGREDGGANAAGQAGGRSGEARDAGRTVSTGPGPTDAADSLRTGDVAFTTDTAYAIEPSCLQPRVVAASARLDPPAVMLEFDRASAHAFAELSTRCVGRRLIIRLDGVVQSAPVVLEPITGGKAMLSAQLTEEQLELLAASLAGGALPGLTLLTEGTWGPPSLLP